ncbi:MAG TPA: imidazole glycerol phosphate synthase subunit HisH, partial [Flavobacterium sp.]|nr:imidazole glycerol phosphate synthase subunit HisH [Flavobacterium sp.]
GMQLLCNHTQESDTKGLGIFDVEVVKFSSTVKIPQMGWNTIFNLNSKLFDACSENEYVYFVHSYYAKICQDTIATSYYESEFSSALQKDNFYGVQFHPEKSGAFGEKILKNFLTL